MVNREAFEVTRQIITGEFEQWRKHLSEEIQNAKQQAAMRARGNPGVLAAMIDKAYTDEVQRRAVRIWEILHRSITAARIAPAPSLAADLKSEVEKLLKAFCFADCSGALQNGGSAHATRVIALKAACNAARANTFGEIDLFVLSLKNQQSTHNDDHKSIIFINAPVGAIQTGPNARAEVTQSISAQDKDNTLRALSAIQNLLQQNVEIAADQAQVIGTIVAETRDEITKPKTDSGLLKSKLQALATVIQGFETLKEGYNLLKPVLVHFGIPSF